MNIVQIILNLLSSGDTTGKIASLLGISQRQAGEGIGATVPTLLAGLLGSATKPGGAANLANTLAQHEQGADAPSGLFQAPAAGGGNALTPVLGSSMMGQLTGALSRFTGLGEGITSKLVGLVAPVVMGALAKHTKGMDAMGILNLLKGQKENIAEAMPPELKQTLGAAFPEFEKASYSTGSHYHPEHEHVDRTPVGARHEKGSDWSALRWVLPLAAICLALYFIPKMFHRDRGHPEPVAEAVVVEESIGINETAVISEGSTLLKNTHAQLASITDEASAEAALPKLREDTSKLQSLTGLLARLPEPARKMAQEQFRPLVGKLREAAAPVLALPVVGERVKPALDTLLLEADRLLE